MAVQIVHSRHNQLLHNIHTGLALTAILTRAGGERPHALTACRFNGSSKLAVQKLHHRHDGKLRQI